MKKKISKRTVCIIIIYLVALVIFNIHIEQYQKYIQEFPDELSHVAYIAYLKQTGKIIPRFEDMKETEKYKIHLKEYKMLMREENKPNLDDLSHIETNFFEDSTNHLGHPPLYYHIMNIFNLVKVKDEIITYNLKALRNISQVISNIALIIVFALAFKNLKSIKANFAFSIILVNIPLLPYVSGAVSNDVLSLLGLSIFICGLSNIVKEKRDYLTYFLLSIGTFICMLNKITTGVFIVVALLIVVIYLIIKEKNLKFIICKEFAITIPIYLCIALYYLTVIKRYGTIYPGIPVINPEYYKKTSFYNDTIYKPAYTLKMYSKMYWNNFVNYWAGYNYGELFPKHSLIKSLVSLSMFILPIIYLVVEKIRKSKIDIANLSVCIGVYIAIIIQFFRQFIEFKTVSGYLGGYHSRYYLCAMPSFVYLLCRIIDKESNNSIIRVLIIFGTIYI